MKKLSFTLTLLPTVFLFNQAIAQRGLHGALVVNAANTIVNEYTQLTANVGVGATSITVANSALNANGRFSGGLAPGDLIMIYTVQGAWPRNQFDVGATDTTFGKIQTTGDYWDCGRYELAQVLSVPNATTINLACPTQYSYGATGGAIRGQVIRVPRYTTVTVNAGGVLTCDDWNGTVGGVLAVEVDGNMVVNGIVDATGRGFRGGSLAGDNTSTYGVNNTYSTNPDFGAQRGEGIVGYQGDYTVFGGMYGRAPAANGGGGGDAHNAGGGGGANGQNSTNGAAVWTGYGVPDQSVGGWTTAWNIEPPVGNMPLRTNANSEGGGRGGYSFSGNSSNQNATTLPPGNVGWSGDARNYQATGMGGRPLHYDLLPGRAFFGGGGGAGDQNESQGGNGGDGGGFIYTMVFGNLSGTGSIVSNGNNGSNAQGVPAATSYSGSDGAGGGGGGGAVFLNVVGTLTGVTATASGGNGGNQIMQAGGLYFTNGGNIYEAEGPGGGGGGGHIAVSTGAITRTANGGANGTTNSGGLTEFPPNGATRGCPGTNNATVTNYNITATNVSICAGQSTTLTATVSGTPAPGYTVSWYATSTGGTALGTGTTYNTGVLVTTTTYWVGICPGFYRIPVTVTVNTTPAAPTLSSNSPVCSGNTLTLFANTVAGGTYTWTGPNSFSSGTEDPTIGSVTTAASGTYSLTISVGGCTSPMSTIAVTINPTPAAPTVGSNSPLCAGQNLNLTANTVVGATYTWTGPNSFSSALEDPTIASATTAASGTYSLTITVGGCTSAMSTVAVTVSNTPSAPTLGSNSPVCSGNSLNLTANTVVGGTYTWTGPNSFSSGTEDPTITNVSTAASGTYSLTISVGGCTSPMSTIAVTVNPTPAAPTVGSNSPLCSGQNLNLTANTVVGATYTWTGPNSFSSALEDPTIASATTAASGTYSLTITVGGCTSAMSTVAVTVSNTPSAPTLGSNSPVCSGNALNLTANTVVGGTYTWTGPNSFSSALEDPTIASATTAASGTYSLTISVGGCTSPMSTVAVTVNATPAAPTVGSNSPLCSGQTLNLTANTVVGATYTWTGPNSFSSALEDPTIGSVTTAASGTYSLTITQNGCTSAMSTVAVTVSNTPSAPTLGSNSPVCSGNALNLTANTVVGGTYTWTGPNSFSSALEDPTIASATTAASGTYSLTISVGGCTSPMSTVAVTVNPTPAAPTVGSNSPICAGQNLNLTANTVVGATYTWTGPNSFSSALEDPTIASATTAATGTYSLTITVGGCTSAQSTVNVIVGTTPSAPTLGSNSPVCSGNTLNLTANTVVGGTYNWTGPNSFSSALEDPTIGSVTTAASGTYSLTISIGGCTSPQSTISVTINPTPAAPTVGSNTPVCSGNTLNLTANTVVGATYAWTGPNSFSSALEDPTIGSATTAASGTYSLTITVGGCTSAMSTVAVTVNPTPAAPTLGSNTPVCSGNTLNLTANTVVGATYAWTGPNSFSSALEDPSITGVTTAASGTYSLTITANGCSSPMSTVAVVVNATPAAAGAGSNTPVCAGQTLNLTSNTVGGATYSWTGPNSFSSALEDPSIASATTAASGTYYVTVTVSGCTSPLDSVAVVVNPLPTVAAGSDVAICAGDSALLNGSGSGTYAWTSVSGLSCSSCAGPMASPSSTTTYTLTVTDGNGCVNTDDVLVTVNPLPVAAAGSGATLCSGDSVTLNGSGGGSYSWLPVTDLSNASIGTPVASPTVTTTYTLQVTDGNGCQDTAAVTITINPLPVVSAGPDQSMCPLGNVPLNATGANTYLWSPSSGLSCTSCSNPVATPAVTTVYYLEGRDTNGCINYDTITVTVSNNLLITASTSQPVICAGDSVTLGATGGSGTFVWTPSASLSNANIQNPTAGPSATTTYVVNVTDPSGCTGTDSITVQVNQPVAGTASAAPATICIGQTASLSATATGGDGNYTYTWNPGPQTGSTVSVSPATTTVYTVDITDGVGCADQQTITVTVNPPITASVAQSALSICSGGSSPLGASATGGDGNYAYTWSPAAGLSSTTVSNPTATPAATTTYTVVVSDGCGSPLDSATVTVTVNSPPVVTASALNLSGCAPFCTDFDGQSTGSCSSTLWNFGDGNTNNSTSTLLHCFALPGVYNSVYTCTDANGCTASDSVTITVFSSPVADFSSVSGNTITLTAGSTTQACFTDNSTGAQVWNWSFGTATSNSQSPCFTVSDTGAYTATLLVTNAQGCSDTATLTINVENPCTDLFLPNAFSPNGDGQNDVLFIYGSCIKYLQLEIYSRWGERVFITNDPQIGWDGTWRGEACEPAVFTYVLRATLSDDSQIEKQGNITLIR